MVSFFGLQVIEIFFFGLSLRDNIGTSKYIIV